ncbi:MAG: diacylglycerol kinase family lipid kinase [Anaerolineae bacterium]|jgi:YegS/Rv2252/BmrU family lipid kinase
MTLNELERLMRESLARQQLQEATGRTDALLIYNPTAGPRAELRRDLERVVAYLGERGWHVTMRTTRKPGDATELARAAVAAHCKAVLVAGGDGTINEVVNGLVGSDTAMGVLPVGTGNVWAKEIGLPTLTLAQGDRLLAAARMLVDGEVRRVDVGRAGERYFLVCAGVGFDSTVTAQMEPRTRTAKQLGVLAYMSAGVWIARDFGGVRSTIVIDGHTIRTKMILIVVSNAQLYGGLVRMSPEALLDDGLLDIRIFKGLGPVWVFRHVAGVFTHRHLRDPAVLHYQGRQVAIYTAEPFPVQMDGEPVGMTPVSLEVVPRALRVLVPKAASANRFASDHYSVLPSLPPRSRLQWVYEMGLRLRDLAQTATQIGS